MDFHSTDIQHLQHLLLDVHLESDQRSEVTEGNLELLLPPNSSDSHHTQIQQDLILDQPNLLISLKENSSTG